MPACAPASTTPVSAVPAVPGMPRGMTGFASLARGEEEDKTVERRRSRLGAVQKDPSLEPEH